MELEPFLVSLWTVVSVTQKQNPCMTGTGSSGGGLTDHAHYGEAEPFFPLTVERSLSQLTEDRVAK